MSKASKTRWRQRRRDLGKHGRYFIDLMYEARKMYRSLLEVHMNNNGEFLALVPKACKDDTAKEKSYNVIEV